jgi:hypothetical protein
VKAQAPCCQHASSPQLIPYQVPTPVFRDLSDRAGLGVVAGAASARGASTRAAASAGEEEEKSIFQRVTKVEK